MEISQFNIRVYGLLLDDNRILVTDEYRLGIFMTKFPGVDCVSERGLPTV